MRRGRVDVRESRMAIDDEDFPAAYLLYAIAVMVVIAIAAVSIFFLFVR